MNQAHRQIQRLAYSRKLAELQERMVDRLDQILSRYGDLEADALASLSDYAFIFEQYGEISGTQGIGQLLASAQELEKLNKKLRQMQDFGKGLELHMLDVGHLMNHRLAQIAGQDVEMGSRRDLLTTNSQLMERNDRLLRELEKEVGQLQAAAGGRGG